MGNLLQLWRGDNPETPEVHPPTGSGDKCKSAADVEKYVMGCGYT